MNNPKFLSCCAAGAVFAPVVAVSIPLRNDDLPRPDAAANDDKSQLLAKAGPEVRVSSRQEIRALTGHLICIYYNPRGENGLENKSLQFRII